MKTVSLFVYDYIFVSEKMVEVKITVIRTLSGRYPSFKVKVAQLSDEHLNSFTILYKARFGKELTRNEALEKGLSLMHLVKTVILENRRQEKITAQLENK